MISGLPAPECLLPAIVVAVTGHRDLVPDDIPVLESVLAQELDAISKRYPNSHGLLLTGLAEGADRLAAKCALACGWRIGAILPLPAEEYEQDFGTEGSRAEFRELLHSSDWVHVVSDMPLPRPECYAALGSYLARYAMVLFAFWDGIDSREAGGTCDTLRLFREGELSSEVVPPDSGPVIHIATRRLRNPTQCITAGQISRLHPCPAGLPGEGEDRRWEQVMHRIDEFNAQAHRVMGEQTASVIRARDYLVGDDSPPMSASADRAAWLHAVADTLSSQAQAKRSIRLNQIFGLAACSLLTQFLYGGPVAEALVLLMALLFGVSAFGVLRLARAERVDEHYLDYRTLAEAYRVQTYWKLAGVLGNASDYCLREQRDELEWIRQSVTSAEAGLPRSAGDLSTLRHCRDAWIEDQRRWFVGDGTQGKAKIQSDLGANWHRCANWMAMGSLVVVAILLPFHAFVASSIDYPGDEAVAWGLFFFESLLAASGIFQMYQEIMAYDAHALRYRQMALVMTVARNRLDRALAHDDLSLGQEIVFNAGKEALAETSSWLMLHRARPVSVPLGG